MNRAFATIFNLAVLFSILSPVAASTDIAIDALHGLPELQDYNIDLYSLYPDYNFISFERERIPISTPIRYGLTRGNWEPSNFQIELTEEADALYLILDINYTPGSVDQLPFIDVIAPDQSRYRGHFGMWHLDNALPGTYDITLSGMEESLPYRVGTGPSFWDVYPPEDYKAILYLNGFTWQFFRGLPELHSGADMDRLEDYLDSGGGYGLIYDAEEPVAMKPIIRVSGFDSPVDLSIDIPGHLTYRNPQVATESPAVWTFNSARSAQEILYEAAFLQPLNFISYDPVDGSVSNRSWAVTNEVRLIEFIPFRGYRLTDYGTIQPGGVQKVGKSAVYSAREIEDLLKSAFMIEADDAGMTAEETESFFSHKYNWIPQLLADATNNSGPVCLYRIEEADYERLLPLTVTPQPQEIVRVLWVYSMLSNEGTEIATVHPRADYHAQTPVPTAHGVVHEYGFFRERYGGSLDEIEEWDWHCYDGALADPTDHAEWEEQIEFHTTGSSPLVSTFMDQVQIVQGNFTTAISPLAGDAEVILKGDDDTYSWNPEMPFPSGSYPPVVVARETNEGGRLTAYADLDFFADYADNLLFNENMFTWLAGEAQDPVPDIDIADAVLEAQILNDEPTTTSFTVINRGDADLTYTVTAPAAEWITVTGPIETTLAAGESADYELTWHTLGLDVGFHTTTMGFSTNDPNESELDWPITLRIMRTSDVSPVPVHANSFELLNAFPNPFNSQVSIRFVLEQTMKVDFILLNILGQEVESMSQELWTRGTHTLTLDFSNQPSGLYFLKASASDSHQLIKLMHLK